MAIFLSHLNLWIYQLFDILGCGTKIEIETNAHQLIDCSSAVSWACLQSLNLEHSKEKNLCFPCCNFQNSRLSSGLSKLLSKSGSCWKLVVFEWRYSKSMSYLFDTDSSRFRRNKSGEVWSSNLGDLDVELNPPKAHFSENHILALGGAAPPNFCTRLRMTKSY